MNNPWVMLSILRLSFSGSTFGCQVGDDLRARWVNVDRHGSDVNVCSPPERLRRAADAPGH